MPMLIDSHWVYDGSEELNQSILVLTGGRGKLYFHNDLNEKNLLTVKYSYLAAGVAKGAIWNYAEALTTDPGGAFSRIQTFGARPQFGPKAFPGAGYVVFFGGSAGVFTPSFVDQGGLTLAAFLFGAVPQAGILVWGRYKSVLPSIGPAIGVCKYSM